MSDTIEHFQINPARRMPRTEPMNELTAKIESSLSEFGAKWWTPPQGGQPRLYLNPRQWQGTRYAKTHKCWLSFVDAETLAGAKLHVRVTMDQHPNWIAKEEEMWSAQFESALEVVASIRSEEGLDAAQEQQAIQADEAVRAAIAEAAADEHVEQRRQAMADIEIKRASALTVSEIVNKYGNVDVRIPLGRNFVQVDFTEAQLKESGIQYAAAFTGFETNTVNRAGRRGGSYEICKPRLSGFVIAKADFAKVKTPEQIASEKTAARKIAKKQAAEDAGFDSVAAYDRHLKAEGAKAVAAQAAKRQQQAAAAQANRYSDVDAKGLTGRDEVTDSTVTLVNFKGTRRHTVSRVSFEALTGPGPDRRDAAWNLPTA